MKKLRDIIGKRESIMMLAKLDLPGKTALRVRKLLKQYNEVVAPFDQLLRDYQERAQGMKAEEREEFLKKANLETMAALDAEVEYSPEDAFKMSDIEVEGSKFKALDLFALEELGVLSIEG